MTLDELLALLPTNTTGEISAADMRTIVTDLYQAAHLSTLSSAFDYSTDPTPPSGRLTVVGGWSTAATGLLVSTTTADGEPTPFLMVDRGDDVRFVLSAGPDVAMRGEIAGPSVDQGAYRSVPVTVSAVAGLEPVNNTAMVLTVGTVVEL